MMTNLKTDDCRAIWLAVIHRVILDAKWEPGNSKEDSRSNGIPHPLMVNARGSALRWLRGNTRDFYEVCDNAGLNPLSVKRMAIEVLGEDLIWETHLRVSEVHYPKKELTT